VADDPDLSAAGYGAGPDACALAPAEQVGLVTVDRAGLQFSHPLVRSAIYHSVPFAQRAAAHRRLAQALRDQPDRRAWHLAAAALQPEEGLASLLEETATQAQRRGWTSRESMTLHFCQVQRNEQTANGKLGVWTTAKGAKRTGGHRRRLSGTHRTRSPLRERRD
jgi:hypothetical protein